MLAFVIKNHYSGCDVKFTEAKTEALKALKAGRVHHEPREVRAQKNLLAIGAISIDEAIALIAQTRGTQARSSPFHRDPSIRIWIFKPRDWYIKFYFIEDCFFVSFHQTHCPAPTS
jgi:hypothetical protein